MGDLFMEKTNKEETKPILCYGKDFSGYLQYYLNFVGVEVVPVPSQNTEEFYKAEFRDKLSVRCDRPAVTRDDNNAINIKFSYRNFEILGDSIAVKAIDDEPYVCSFRIKELENGGFILTVTCDRKRHNKQMAVVTVKVDMLNNVDIFVGRSENKFDHRIRIPAGKSEYGDANLYLNGIFDALRISKGYSDEELIFLRLPFHDPRLLSRLNELIKKIPSDIKAAFDEKKAEIKALAQEKIDDASRMRDADIAELTAIRDTALKLQDEALASIDYLEGRRLDEYMDALEGAKTGDTK